MNCPELSNTDQCTSMSDLYDLSSHYWGGDRISLHSLQQSGDIFATFPPPFLRDNGINTWEYVLNVANMLVNQDSDQSGSIQYASGEEVDLAAAPSSGHYVYRLTGTSELNTCIDSAS